MSKITSKIISYLLLVSMALSMPLQSLAEENDSSMPVGGYDYEMLDSFTDLLDDEAGGAVPNSEELDEKMAALYADESDIAVSDEEDDYTDVSTMSDEEFFGVWDENTGEWSIKGKLNYDYSEDLAEVERLVKLNSYALARDALLEYYKNRKNIGRPGYASNIFWEEMSINLREAYTFGESALTYVNVENAGEYQLYSVDLMGYTGYDTFLISSFYKTQDMVQIASRESDYSPSLLIYKKDGSSVTLYPNKDTYIRGYDDDFDYSHEVYGDSKELFVKDAYCQRNDGTYKPYSSKTRRTYIAFDKDKYPSDIDRMYLQFYAKIVPEEGSTEVTETSHELTVFQAYNTSWSETEDDNSSFAPMTWADYVQAHYSFNGVPGGFNYNWQDNVPSEWLNLNTRFINQNTMAKAGILLGKPEYIEKSISSTLAFIKNADDRILNDGGVPKNRDMESASRVANFPAMMSIYLEADLLTADALTDMLKWLWHDTTYLYDGAGILYQGRTTIPTANNYAETNRGLHHVRGFEAVCTYFPEFADRDEWKVLADERLKVGTDVLINDDGCYGEPTFSYPGTVLNYYSALNKVLTDGGDELPDWYEDKVRKLAKYIMYVSYPNDTPPRWGEGAPGASRLALNEVLNVIDDDELKYYVTRGDDGSEPETMTKYFDKLKLVTTRTAWDSSASMMMMSAKNGGNHNHKDSLALMWYSGYRDILADTGMTTYDARHPHFQWQRHMTRSHNTIEIDETPQRGSDFLYNTSDDQLLWNGESSLNLVPNEIADRITAWTDATEGFRHYRNVTYIKNHDLLIVSDMVSPDDEDEHSYTQNWHTSAKNLSHPVIDTTTKQGKTGYYDGTNLIISQALTDNLDLTLEEGYSADDASRPTEYFCYKKTGVGNVAYNTVLYSRKTGTSADVTTQNIDTGTGPSIASAMNVNLFVDDDDALNVVYYNSFEENPKNRTFGDYSTDASNAMIMQDAFEKPSFISMYNGKEFRTADGSAIVTSDRKIDDIEIEFDDSQAVITSRDESAAAASLIIKAPESVDVVKFNGERIPFAYSNGLLYINNNDALDMSSDCGYVFSDKAVNGKKSYFVTVDIPENALVSGALRIPKCVFENDYLKIDMGDAKLRSCAKVTVDGHTGKSASITYNGAVIGIGKTSKVGMSRAEADSNVNETSPLAENAREDLVIWSKLLGTFTVGAAASSDSSTGGSGNISPGIKSFPTGGGITVPDDNKGDENGGNDDNKPTAPFTDISGHWSQDDIEYMYSKGFVKGKTDTEFDPDSGITRAEFVAIALRCLGITAESYKGVFDDVSDSDWYSDIVQTAADKGIMTGYESHFRPNDGITREEMAVILVRLYEMNHGIVKEASGNFADSAQISDWAKDSIYRAVACGLMNGVSETEFAPLSGATRAEATTVLKRLTDKVKEVAE